MLLRLICWKLLTKSEKNSGFSFIENLVAIVIISLMVVVTTPPLLLGMANRIQNRRAQTAVTLAQKELERIRLIVDRGLYENEELPPVGRSTTGPITNPNNISQVGAPTRQPCIITQEANPPAGYCNYRQISTDYEQPFWTDDSQEYFVQIFRDTGVTQSVRIRPNPTQPARTIDQVVVFRVGVRVYARPSREQIGDLRTESAPIYLSREPGEQVAVQGRDNSIRARAARSQFPLAVIYDDFARGDLNRSLERYHEFLGN